MIAVNIAAVKHETFGDAFSRFKAERACHRRIAQYRSIRSRLRRTEKKVAAERRRWKRRFTAVLRTNPDFRRKQARGERCLRKNR